MKDKSVPDWNRTHNRTHPSEAKTPYHSANMRLLMRRIVLYVDAAVVSILNFCSSILAYDSFENTDNMDKGATWMNLIFYV